MAHVLPEVNYRFELNHQEARLMMLALSGLLKDFKDIEEAKKLGDALFKQRAKQIMSYAKMVQPKEEDSLDGTPEEPPAAG